MSISAGALLALLAVAAAPPGTRAIRDSFEADATLDVSEELIDHSSELSEIAAASQELVEYSSKHSDIQGEDTEQKLVTKDVCPFAMLVTGIESQRQYLGQYNKTKYEQGGGRPVYKSQLGHFIFYWQEDLHAWLIGKDWRRPKHRTINSADDNFGIASTWSRRKDTSECPDQALAGHWYEFRKVQGNEGWYETPGIMVKEAREPEGGASKPKPGRQRRSREEQWQVGDIVKATSKIEYRGRKGVPPVVIMPYEWGEIFQVLDNGDVVADWKRPAIRDGQPDETGMKTVKKKDRGKLERVTAARLHPEAEEQPPQAAAMLLPPRQQGAPPRTRLLTDMEACAEFVMVHSSGQEMAQEVYGGVYKKTKRGKFNRPIYESEKAPHRYIYYADVGGKPAWVMGLDDKDIPKDGNYGIRLFVEKSSKNVCPHEVPAGKWFEYDDKKLFKKWNLNKDIVVEPVDPDALAEVPQVPQVPPPVLREQPGVGQGADEALQAYPLALDLEGAEKRAYANGRWDLDGMSPDSLPIYKRKLVEQFDMTASHSQMYYMFFQAVVGVWMVAPDVHSTGSDAILKSEETGAKCPSQVRGWTEYQRGWRDNPNIKVVDPNLRAQGTVTSDVKVEKVMEFNPQWDKQLASEVLKKTKGDVAKAVSYCWDNEEEFQKLCAKLGLTNEGTKAAERPLLIDAQGTETARERQGPLVAVQHSTASWACPPVVYLQGCHDKRWAGGYTIRQGGDGGWPLYQHESSDAELFFSTRSQSWIISHIRASNPDFALLMSGQTTAWCPHKTPVGQWYEANRDSNYRFYPNADVQVVEPPKARPRPPPQQRRHDVQPITQHLQHLPPDTQSPHGQQLIQQEIVSCESLKHAPDGWTCSGDERNPWKRLGVVATAEACQTHCERVPIEAFQQYSCCYWDGYGCHWRANSRASPGSGKGFSATTCRKTTITQAEPVVGQHQFPQQQRSTKPHQMSSNHHHHQASNQAGVTVERFKVTADDVAKLTRQEIVQRGYDETTVNQAFDRFKNQQDWAKKVADHINGLTVIDDEVIGDSEEYKVQQVMSVTGKSKEEAAQALRREGGDANLAIDRLTK